MLLLRPQMPVTGTWRVGGEYGWSMPITSWGTYVPSRVWTGGHRGRAVRQSGSEARSRGGIRRGHHLDGRGRPADAVANLPVSCCPNEAISAANPAYLDKTNAPPIHAALGLPSSVAARSRGGAVRSGLGAMILPGRPHAVVVATSARGSPAVPTSVKVETAAAFVMASESAVGGAMQLRPIATSRRPPSSSTVGGSARAGVARVGGALR